MLEAVVVQRKLLQAQVVLVAVVLEITQGQELLEPLIRAVVVVLDEVTQAQ
jgi:hypothetical protein